MIADFNKILEHIAPWSLFEINRLGSALAKLLNDPARNEAIKRQLKIGMRISYFCSNKNSLVEARIEEIRKTWVSVADILDGEKWDIQFCLINLQGIDTNINPNKYLGSLDRNSLKVGDRVGWHSKLGHDLYGIIKKLNPKKALIQLSNDAQWTVPYSLLFLVMDGSSIPPCIDGTVI